MKSACLILLVIGMTQAAMQQRSPVYPSSSSTGANTPTGTAGSAKSSLMSSQPAPVLQPVINQPTAQAREGQQGTTADTAMQPGTPGTAPSQNYLVYYYPNNPEYRNVPTQVGGQQQYAAYPQKTEGSSILNWSGWREVGYASSAIVLFVAGSTALYSAFGGQQIKARAMKQLENMSVEDAAAMTTKFFSALERFQGKYNNQ